MARPGEGNAFADAIFVLLIFIALFILWISIGGQNSRPTDIFLDDPFSISYLSTSTETTLTSTSTTATSSRSLADADPDRLIFVLGFLATLVFIFAAKYHSPGGGK